MFELFVLGTSELELISIETDTYVTGIFNWEENVEFTHKIKLVRYECFVDPTLFRNYEEAKKALEEIQRESKNLVFVNESVIGGILDREHDFQFDATKLKIFRMCPMKMTDEEIRIYEETE